MSRLCDFKFNGNKCSSQVENLINLTCGHAFCSKHWRTQWVERREAIHEKMSSSQLRQSLQDENLYDLFLCQQQHLTQLQEQEKNWLNNLLVNEQDEIDFQLTASQVSQSSQQIKAPQNEELKSINYKLTMEIQELYQQLNNKKNQQIDAQMVIENNSLKQQIQQLNIQLNSKENEVKSLKSENLQIQQIYNNQSIKTNNISQMEQVKKSLEENTNSKEEQFQKSVTTEKLIKQEEYEKQVKQWQTQMEELNNNYSKLQNKYDLSQFELKQIVEANEKVKKDFENQQQQNQKIVSEIKEKKDKLQEVIQERDSLLNKLEVSKKTPSFTGNQSVYFQQILKENQELTLKNNEHEGKISVYVNQLQELNEEKQIYKEKGQKDQALIQKYEQDLNKIKEKLQQTIFDASQQIKDKTEDINRRDQLLNDLRINQQELKEEIKKFKLQMRDQAKTIENQNQEIEILKKDNTVLNQEALKLEAAYENEKKLHQLSKNQEANLNENIQNLKSNLTQIENQAKVMQQEIFDYQQKEAQWIQNLKQIQEEFEKANQEKMQLRTIAFSNNINNNSLQEENKKQKIDLQEKQNQLQEQIRKVEKKKLKIQQLKSQILDLSKQQGQIPFQQQVLDQQTTVILPRQECSIQQCKNQNLIKLQCNKLICNTHLLQHIELQTNGYIIPAQNEPQYQINCKMPGCNGNHLITQEMIQWACGQNFQKYVKFAVLRSKYVYRKDQQFCLGGRCEQSKSLFFIRNCNCQDQICVYCAVELILSSQNPKCCNKTCELKMNQEQVECLSLLKETFAKMNQTYLDITKFNKAKQETSLLESCILCNKQVLRSQMTLINCGHYACSKELENFVLNKFQQNQVSQRDLACFRCNQPFDNQVIKKLINDQTYNNFIYLQKNQPNNLALGSFYPGQNKMNQNQIQQNLQKQFNYTSIQCQKCNAQGAVFQKNGYSFCQQCQKSSCYKCGQNKSGICKNCGV